MTTKSAFIGAEDTETVSVSDTNAQATLGVDSPQVLVTVDGDIEVFLKFGTSAQTATIATSSIHLKGNGTYVVSKPLTHRFVGLICASGQSGTVYLTPGAGDSVG